MGWQFRKSKKFGPARFTLSKRGISSSVGGGPFRIGMGSDGRMRRTLRIPGSGLYSVKTYGSGRTDSGDGSGAGSPLVASRRRGHPFLTLIGLAVLASIVWSACGTSDKQAQTGSTQTETVRWDDAPTDGTWASPPPRLATSFGHTSPPGVTVFSDYTFSITEPPRLTTDDGGKTVTMVSNVTVNRVQDNGSGKTIDKGNVFLFHPGETTAIYQYDESHGTNTDVNCQKDRITVSESTTCTVAFTAAEPGLDGGGVGAYFPVEHLGVKVGAVLAQPTQSSGFPIPTWPFSLYIIQTETLGPPVAAIRLLHCRVERINKRLVSPGRVSPSAKAPHARLRSPHPAARSATPTGRLTPNQSERGPVRSCPSNPAPRWAFQCVYYTH